MQPLSAPSPFPSGCRSGSAGWLAGCAGLAIAIALYDEWRQLMLPGREADLLDLLANCVGVALAVMLARHLRSQR
jgi:VanZ family protein